MSANKTRIISITLTLVGALFCLLNLFTPNAFHCTDTGCRLYGKMTLLGIPIFGWGTLFFFLIFLALIFKPVKVTILLELGVLIDTFLLSYQLYNVICTKCLIVAFFLGLTSIVIFASSRRKRSLILLFAWWTFFSGAIFTSYTQNITRPYPIWGKPDAPLKVFFSPSCKTCQALMESLMENSRINECELYPVPETYEDQERICFMLEKINEGYSFKDAFYASLEKADDLSKYPAVKAEKFRRNLRFLLKNNITTVPIVLARDISVLWTQRAIDSIGIGTRSRNGCSTLQPCN